MLNIYQIIREVLDEYISIYEEYTKYKREYNNKLNQNKEEVANNTTETTETTKNEEKKKKVAKEHYLYFARGHPPYY